MKSLSSYHTRSFRCFLIVIAAVVCAMIAPTAFPDQALLTGLRAAGQKADGPKKPPRFDELVRGDFFAGMMGDETRLNRGMRICEEILATNPKHADALVWHGGGLLTRAAKAYAKGDSSLGDSLWNRGLDEMDQAVEFEPKNMGVKIGRSATLIGLAQAGWDPRDARGRELLLSALTDYEKVYSWQKPFFRKISIHSRGELLFGLASGWSILGDKQKAAHYLRLIVEECEGSNYEREARHWLDQKPLSVVQHDCKGCH